MVAHRSGISESELSEDVANGVIEDCMDLYSDERLPNPSMFMPSMLVDLLAGRPMEVEPIVGGVLGVAREVGVATPRQVHSTAIALASDITVRKLIG